MFNASRKQTKTEQYFWDSEKKILQKTKNAGKSHPENPFFPENFFNRNFFYKFLPKVSVASKPMNDECFLLRETANITVTTMKRYSPFSSWKQQCPPTLDWQVIWIFISYNQYNKLKWSRRWESGAIIVTNNKLKTLKKKKLMRTIMG